MKESPYMKFSTLSLTAAFITSACAGFAIGSETVNAASTIGADHYPVSIAHPDELFKQELAKRMFGSLPVEQQVKIAEADGIGSQEFDITSFARSFDQRDLSHIPTDKTAIEFLGMLLSDAMRDELTEQQLTMVQAIAKGLDEGIEMPAMCFAPGTNPKFAFLIDQLFDYQFVSDDGSRYQQGPRWSNTATDGGGLGQGDVTVLTYSFAPDGAFVPEALGLGAGPSEMFAWLGGLYGNTIVWQSLFHQVFDRWAELTGVSYVWEENDDGIDMSSGGGVIGVRGDIRIFAYNYPNDGNGGVLAYNYFPNNGDMAFDAFDSFYNSTSNNSLRFRNVTAHEHGHGLGMPHVCPANQTKLMEPFVSTQYDGPQLDDILNGIRNYGDFAEPNDSRAQATELGVLPPDSALDMDNLGIDDNSDTDYFHLTLTQSSRVTFTVIPDADEYLQGPQTQSCDSGTMTDYNDIQDLQVTVLDSSGTVLASSNTNATGLPETLVFDALFAGEFYFVVNGATSINGVQRYRLEVGIEGLGFINPIILTTLPDEVNPGFETPFSVNITPQSDVIVPGTEKLFYAVNDGEYASVDLVFVSDGDYTATLPAANCNEMLGIYISVEGESAGEITFPLAGASDPFHPMVNDFATIFVDNFEDDLGWTVSGPVSGALEGEWERGIPAGFGDRGDPPFDSDFSGSAFLTGNQAGNTDVDDGQTILKSPRFRLADNPESLISYSRWFDNTGSGTGTAPGEDVFRVEISNNNGSTWTELETVGPKSAHTTGGWFNVQFRIADFVNPTNGIRVRFIAEDIGDPSVIEAAIDAFLTGEPCPEPPVICPADLTDDGILDFFDVSAFLSGFNNQDPISDFTDDGIFDFFDISAFLQAFAAGCP